MAEEVNINQCGIMTLMMPSLCRNYRNIRFQRYQQYLHDTDDGNDGHPDDQRHRRYHHRQSPDVVDGNVRYGDGYIRR